MTTAMLFVSSVLAVAVQTAGPTSDATEELRQFAVVLLAVSLATERAVVVLKTLFPFLRETTDPAASVKSDGLFGLVRRGAAWLFDKGGQLLGLRVTTNDDHRRLVVLAVGVAAAWVTTALIADWQSTLQIGSRSYPVLLIAFLASGGSAFWAQVVAYASAVKDARRVELASQPTGEAAAADRYRAAAATIPHGAVALAQEHLKRSHPDADFVQTGEVRALGQDLKLVTFQQQRSGIPVLDSAVVVRIDRGGRIAGESGEVERVPPDRSHVPQGDVTTAAQAALAHAELPFVGPVHVKTQMRTLATQPAALELGPGGQGPSANASLVWYADDPNDVRLAWLLEVYGGAREYRAVVAADGTSEVLSIEQVSAHLAELRGDVWEFGAASAPKALDFPPPEDHPRLPFLTSDRLARDRVEWIDDSSTSGNYTRALVGNGPDTVGSAQGVFAPGDHVERGVVNAFYFCNLLHGFFECLGFDEAWGSFQLHGHSGQGRDGDRLDVRVYDQPFDGIASMSSGTDGTRLEMWLGTHDGLLTALDAEVIAHEYTHGVTNRMIGRDTNMTRPLSDHRGKKIQSAAMSEGYSDYFALTFVNYLRRAAGAAPNWEFGSSVVSASAGGGLRARPYTDSFDLTFGDLHQSRCDRYEAGQVWGMALIGMHETLRASHQQAGELAAWRLVVESLKEIVPGKRAPHFLHGRDALLQALRRLSDAQRSGVPASEIETALWDSFKARGMGPSAKTASTDFGSITGGRE